MNSKEQRLTVLRSLGPSFCLAKWLQVTLDLEHGTTHSCHHPKRHLVPPEGLNENPSLLHNTPYKKRQRAYMIEGLRPKECSYCWDIEDTNSERLSDRLIKSTDDWAFLRLNEIYQDPQSDFAPSYLEVMFSSKCNLCCVYCMSDISSRVHQEMNDHGPYLVHQSEHRETQFKTIGFNNPYIDAFWKWFPQIITRLKYFRITGGEPFLDSNFKKVLNILEDSPQKELIFALNSNCSLPYSELEQHILSLKKIVEENKIKKFELYASIDAHGIQAEYIRQGLNYSRFFENIEKIKQVIPQTEIIFMITFNIYSFESFERLLYQIEEFKQKYSKISFDIAAIKNPEYLRAEIISNEYEDFFIKIENHMNQSPFFSDHEKEKFQVLKLLLKKPINPTTLQKWKKDFISFTREFDKRHKVSFKTSFPNLFSKINMPD